MTPRPSPFAGIARTCLAISALQVVGLVLFIVIWILLHPQLELGAEIYERRRNIYVETERGERQVYKVKYRVERGSQEIILEVR